jgi:O-antigen/teichoic acid export membrane protein
LSSSIFSRFFAGTISLGFARLSLIIFGLITIIIAVRYVPPEEYGAFVLLLVILSFLTEFTGFGLSLAIPQSIAGSTDPLFKCRVINTAIWFRVLTVIAAAILILVIRFALDSHNGQSIWSDLLLYLPLLLGLASLESTFESILQGLFQFNLIAIIGIVGASINLILTFVFIVYLRLGILGLIYAKLIPVATQILIAGVYSKIQYKLEFDKKTLREMLAFGFPLQLQFVLDFAYSRTDTLIITSMLGTSGTAYYEIARKIPDSLMQLYNAFRSVYFPMLTELYASNQREKAYRLLNTSVRVLSFTVLLGAMISVTFGKEIILLLFSAQYLGVYPIFVLMMVWLGVNVLENTVGYSLIAIGEPDKPLIVNIVRTVISLIGNLILIPINGLIGAALVKLFSNIIATPLDILFLVRRRFYVRVSEYIKPLISFGAATAIFYLLSSPLFFMKLGVIALFVVSCLLLSVITKEDFLAFFGETKAIVFKLTAKYRNGI